MEGRQCPWRYTPSRKATAKRGSASLRPCARVPARAVSRPGGRPSVGDVSLRFLDRVLDHPYQPTLGHQRPRYQPWQAAEPSACT
jgi:hypothetical protein